jgi:hypothetical protein
MKLLIDECLSEELAKLARARGSLRPAFRITVRRHLLAAQNSTTRGDHMPLGVVAGR